MAVRVGPTEAPLFAVSLDRPIGQLVLDANGTLRSLRLVDLSDDTADRLAGLTPGMGPLELEVTPLGGPRRLLSPFDAELSRDGDVVVLTPVPQRLTDGS